MRAAIGLLWSLSACALQGASAQNPGKVKKEGQPPLPYASCSERLCKLNAASVTLDASLRHLQENGGGRTCYLAGGSWDEDLCPDPDSCANSCEIAGVTSAEYTDRYGVKPLARGLQLRYVTETAKTQSYGSRVFMMHETHHSKYKLFKLKNREVSVTVDAAQLPCGLRGAVYLVAMDPDGSKTGGNTAGAKYGTGYCDAQCPRDVKYIQGEVNVLDWHGSGGTMVGRFGSCCSEIDLWEGNSNAMSFGARPCKMQLAKRCKGKLCGPKGRAQLAKGKKSVGLCDKAGCGFNPFLLGHKGFYGAGDGYTIDSSHPFTVVTQFITSDGTDNGDLVEIRRSYFQKDQEISNTAAKFGGKRHGNAISNAFCRNQRESFHEEDNFSKRGGLKRLGSVLDKGMVLVMAIEDDSRRKNRWLDSRYPRGTKRLGTLHGPCAGGDDSSPDSLRSNSADAQVSFTRIAYGAIGTTLAGSRQLNEDLNATTSEPPATILP